MESLPERFVERLGEVVPAERYGEVLRLFGVDRPVFFRVNRLKVDSDEIVLDELRGDGLEVTEWGVVEAAYFVPFAQRDILTHHAAFGDGRIYIQNAASLLAAPLLGVGPGDTVLDLAAAPGGKTLHLAQLMRNEGTLAAVEPVRGRFHRLQANLERGGVTIAKCYPHDGRDVGRKTPGRFDRVMLDAPCSAEARMDPREPESFAFWHEKKIAESGRKQKMLLRSAIDACRVGGRVLYCTCTLAPEENELVVQHTLKRMGERVQLIELDMPEGLAKVVGGSGDVLPGLAEWKGKVLDERVRMTRRLLPTAWGTAFYFALFEKID